MATLAAWCAEANRLIVELRTAGATLEEAYLDLVGGTGAAAVSRPASPPAAALAQALVELRLTARRGENVLVTVIIPAVVLVFFASVGVLPAPAGSPVDFLLPGSIALAIIATSLVNLGIATAYERHYGVLKRLGGSPLSRGGLLAAKVAAVLVVELAQVVLLVAIAVVALGWQPATGANAGLLAVVALLGTFAFAGLGLLLAGTLRAEATLALANALVPRGAAPRRASSCRSTTCPDRWPRSPACSRPPPCPTPSGRRSGPAGIRSRPLAILLVWGGASIALAARFFRWE